MSDDLHPGDHRSSDPDAARSGGSATPPPGAQPRGGTMRTPSGGDRTAATASELTDEGDLGGEGDMAPADSDDVGVAGPGGDRDAAAHGREGRAD
jgi:hypothetical protein